MHASDRWVDRAIRIQLNQSSLTAERERQLLACYHHGHTDAARQAALTELWESHSKLVVAIASRYRRTGAELLDLVGAGHLGLHNAISRFDLDRPDTRLASYAAGWIRWSITNHIRRNAGMVRLPETQACRQLAQMGGKLIHHARLRCIQEQVDPTDQNICERIGAQIGMDPVDVQRSLRLLHGGVVSLHRDDDSDGPNLADTLADEDGVSEDDVITRLDHAKLRRRMLELADEVLGERERAVFLLRCLRQGKPPVRLEAMAERFGVTRERVHQLETSAKKKIAAALISEGFVDAGRDTPAIRRAA